MPSPIYDQHLDRRPANFTPMTPLIVLRWAARTYGPRTAIIHGPYRVTYDELWERSRKLASALHERGIGRGDTVAMIAPNIPALLEAHYGVPMCGAVLNALNTRLDPAALAFILGHGEAKILVVDRAFSKVMTEALALMEGPKPMVIHVDDPLATEGDLIGEMSWEELVAEGDPSWDRVSPDDEWDAITLNYTSGTTGNPKGVVYHHRGAMITSAANIMLTGLGPQSVYLWTLPMFHCNGWCFTWAVTMAGATHVCLRAVVPKEIFEAIAEHGVTHLCGAPVVLNMLIHAPETDKKPLAKPVTVATGGAAPPSAVIARMEGMGFRMIHLYGLTETYGPAMSCAWQPGVDEMEVVDKAAFMSRQGVHHPMVDDTAVINPETMERVPSDGETIGEVMFKGNVVHKGYLKNPKASDECFAGGWYHSGDLGVMHPDGYLEIKDRSKDIIISGGENISSLEVEETLFRHPDIMEAAVVAHPDPHWGETPHAFVTPREGVELTAEQVIEWCRENMARYKCPKHVTFGPLPKNATGKIQKFVLRDQLRSGFDEPAKG